MVSSFQLHATSIVVTQVYLSDKKTLAQKWNADYQHLQYTYLLIYIIITWGNNFDSYFHLKYNSQQF